MTDIMVDTDGIGEGPPRWVAYQPIKTLSPARVNPKQHSHATIRRSMERFGYVEPIVVDERTGRMVAGHGRLEVLAMAEARRMEPPEGIEVINGEWHVPVMHGWSSADDAEAEGYLLTSNQTTIVGGWDRTLLAEVLGEVADTDLGLDGTGFTPDDLAALLQEASADFPLDDPDTDPSLSLREYKVVIVCMDEHMQREVLEACQAHGWDSRAVIN